MCSATLPNAAITTLSLGSVLEDSLLFPTFWSEGVDFLGSGCLARRWECGTDQPLGIGVPASTKSEVGQRSDLESPTCLAVERSRKETPLDAVWACLGRGRSSVAWSIVAHHPPFSYLRGREKGGRVILKWGLEFYCPPFPLHIFKGLRAFGGGNFRGLGST